MEFNASTNWFHKSHSLVSSSVGSDGSKGNLLYWFSDDWENVRRIAIPVAAVLLCTYLSLVRVLRYRELERIQRQYGATYNQFKHINYKDAQAILGNLFLLDSPWMFLSSKDFAFLRAFGISSISEISVGAKKMVEEPGLRYSDTMIFATEWIMNPLDSERARLSLNRVNFIHSRYKNIRNDQMVYTLCLLITEVFWWIDQYDWRKTTALEQYASWVFWKELGIRMGISEESIPATFEECAQFVSDFEAREMGYSLANERIATGIIEMYNSTLPSFIRPLFVKVLVTFTDARLREALGLGKGSAVMSSLVGTALKLRALFVRHCMLPRRTVPPVFVPNKDGTYSVVYWMMQPWYAPATFWNCWGPGALYRRAFGLPNPGKGWKEGGYRLEEVGYKGRGADQVLQVMKQAQEGGCPYSTFGMTKDESSLGGIYAQYAKNAVGCPMAAMASQAASAR